MNNSRLRASLLAPSLLCVALVSAPLSAGAASISTEIDGHVLDAQTGLALPGATITIIGTTITASTNDRGAFAIQNVLPGHYQLRVTHAGYQPTDSDNVTLTAGTELSVTLSLQAADAAKNLTTIGHTSTTLGGSLQTASTIARTLDTETLIETGVTRAGDALREVPGIVNGITGDTASLGDDLQLDFRGIGRLETLTELDGHPIAYGFPNGYNFQLSPVSGIRDIDVTYGSGSNVFGYSAIGGSINFETLDPTPDRREFLSQGYGQYDRSSTQLQLTGSVNRLGYAIGYGVAGLDGPLKDDDMYQPAAAFDQSAINNPAIKDLGIYDDDSGAVSHSGLFKVTYALSSTSNLTATALSSFYWENKTGNGDGDFTPYQVALAQGQKDLSGYKPSAFPQLAACPAGTFVGTNANGQPNGFGPPPPGSPAGTLGAPDGGVTCQTPQQYAAFNTGYDGAGTAWQDFNFGDYHLGFKSTPANQIIRVDAFSDQYLDNQSRLDALPDVDGPGTSDAAKFTANKATEFGATASDTYLTHDDDISLGYNYFNVAYNFLTQTPTSTTIGAPIASEEGFVFHNIYHPNDGPLTTYFDTTLKHASETDTSNVDPRLSLVYTQGHNDVFRLSSGATTTQPSGNELDEPFVPSLPGGTGGGAAINCSSNSIGSAPSSVLKPERGVDEEFAYGHRFFGDSQVQFTLYNDNIYDKLYSTSIPLSQSGTSFINPVFLAEATNAIAAKCGGTALAEATEVITGTVNVGQERARGADLAGRQRLTRSSFIDYDYDIDSTALISVPVALLKSNTTDVIGAQVPHLPLHTFVGAFDQVLGKSVNLRWTVYSLSANNTKALPAYNYSDVRASVAVGRNGLFSVTLSNVFNQWGSIAGLEGLGIPLQLNQYATAKNYAPYLGTAATEQFGLPYRSIYFNFTLLGR